jgi:hypothetical protein
MLSRLDTTHLVGLNFSDIVLQYECPCCDMLTVYITVKFCNWPFLPSCSVSELRTVSCQMENSFIVILSLIIEHVCGIIALFLNFSLQILL